MIAVSPDAELANGRYKAHIRLCCVMGSARSALSKVRLVVVTRGCCIRKERYISQILGILLRRMRAFSNKALTFIKWAACVAGFLLFRCPVRSSSSIFQSLYERGSFSQARSRTKACSRTVPCFRLKLEYAIHSLMLPSFRIRSCS